MGRLVFEEEVSSKRFGIEFLPAVVAPSGMVVAADQVDLLLPGAVIAD